MWTPSHVLVNAFIGHQLKRNVPVRMAALVAGAVAPDVPLLGMTVGYALLRHATGLAAPGEGLYAPGFDDLFFKDALWVVAHNLLHAPFMLAALAVAGWTLRRRPAGEPILWFAAGCGLHAVIDILTHHHDGPLLLFPFDWEYRFMSPVSYWHPAHYGRVAALTEAMMDLGLAAYLALSWRRAVASRHAAPLAAVVQEADP